MHVYYFEPQCIVIFMKAMVQYKAQATDLRRKGQSYKDILQVVPVAKSTLSSWLQHMPLTQSEKIALKDRRSANISRGRIKAAAALRERRINRERRIQDEAVYEYSRHKQDWMFRVGVALYWAEGSKRHGGFSFVNSDPDMMLFMVHWIERFLRVPVEQIKARLYIHKPYAQENCEHFWSVRLGIPTQSFQKTIYKPTGLLIKKRPNYKGCLRIVVDKKNLRLKMLFWQNMMIDEYRQR